MTRKQQYDSFGVAIRDMASSESGEDNTNSNEEEDAEINVGYKPIEVVYRRLTDHLSSPLGRQLDPSTIGQHVANLRTLLKVLHTKNYRKLIHVGTVNSIFQKIKAEKNIQNQTLKRYV